MYVDESGIDRYVHPSHGWAPRGKPVYGKISGKRYARQSFIAAKCGSAILASGPATRRFLIYGVRNLLCLL